MSNEELVAKTAEFVKQKFAEDSTGHDWWHLQRVWKLAKHIAAKEKNADMLVVELTALLHDIADFKFHDGDTEAGPKAAREWLESLEADEKTIAHVEDIIRNVSFKGAKVKNNLNSIEARLSMTPINLMLWAPSVLDGFLFIPEPLADRCMCPGKR